MGIVTMMAVVECSGNWCNQQASSCKNNCNGQWCCFGEVYPTPSIVYRDNDCRTKPGMLVIGAMNQQCWAMVQTQAFSPLQFLLLPALQQHPIAP